MRIVTNNNVLLLAECNIHAGQLDNLRALVSEMIAAIKRDEPGTLNYEWFITDDGKSAHVYERYADSEAFMIHLGILGQKFAERLFAYQTAVKITVYGNPSDEVREVFDNYPTSYMHPLAEFATGSQFVNSRVLGG